MQYRNELLHKNAYLSRSFSKLIDNDNPCGSSILSFSTQVATILLQSLCVENDAANVVDVDEVNEEEEEEAVLVCDFWVVGFGDISITLKVSANLFTGVFVLKITSALSFCIFVGLEENIN